MLNYSRSTLARLGGALVLLLVVSARAEAGPPLICDPFSPEAGAAMLPWDDEGAGWNTPDPGYDRARLVADTLRLLTPAAPILARMENMRRATIYATRDPQVAAALLRAVTARANAAPAAGRGAALAWFDAGYLIESYRQASHVARYDMLSGESRRGWTLAVEPKADGYALVRKALGLAGADAGMEFAASLMTSGATAEAHRRRASATAPAGSALAQHVARSR